MKLRHHRVPTCLFLLSLLALFPLATGCTGYAFLFGAESVPEEVSSVESELGVAIVSPSGPTSAAPGVATVIQWADIASVPGTTVRVSAQRQDNTQSNIGDPIQLVGNGSIGSGRDALADGDSDIFEWDITGVRVGDYVITIVIEAPTGESKTVVSRDGDRGTNGVLTITTGLPVPALTFTAPGATDVTVTTGNTFNITWTDNGNNNTDALLTLSLDPDSNRTNNNEIVLLRNEPLNAGGNTGQFLFAFLDENGATVPDGNYTVVARLDDNAHDPVVVAATGRLLLNP